MRALVTGSAIRVGRAIVLELARHGFDVIIHCHRSTDEAEKVALEVRALGRTAHVVAADLASVDGCRGLVEAVGNHFDGLELLVNNASVFEPRAFEDLDLAHYEWMQAVNSRAPMLITQGLLGLLRAGDHPAVINLCDIGTERPPKGYLAYSMSKIGIEMLTKALAIELAPAIRTMGVAPGQVAWPDDYSEQTREQLAQRIPMRRVGTPEEVATLVRFLALEGSYLNGVIVPVDGGLQHRY